MNTKPDYVLLWNGKNVTKDVSIYVLSVTYEDREEGESDDLQVVLDDSNGIWRNANYPRKGDTLDLKIGWVNGVYDPCGSFQIDELKVTRRVGGDTLTIRALSALITEPLRTKNRARYDNITLKQLANTIASKGQMTVKGIVDNINIKGISQHKETDLAFLRRVSLQYGYIFTIKSRQLVFTKSEALQNREAVARIDPGSFSVIEITDATDLTYKSARHRYYDPVEGKRISYEKQGSAQFQKPDTLESEGYVENSQQAELRAKANWLKTNNGSVSASLEFAYGVSGILAGNNIELTGMGKVSGLYHIQSTRHSVTVGAGARLSADAFKVGEIPATLY